MICFKHVALKISSVSVRIQMLELIANTGRTIILLSILFLLGYVMIVNDRKGVSSKGVTREEAKRLLENFVDCGKDCDMTKTEVIRTVFRNYMGRDPTNEEIDRFGEVMTNSSDVISVVDAVKKSEEYRFLIASSGNGRKDIVLGMEDVSSSPLLVDLDKIEANKRLPVFKKIIDVYVKNLDRIPTNRELTYYAHKILIDGTFSYDKLEQILQGSQEYKMIQKAQSNVVHGELPGNITDAQITMDVRKAFHEVFDRAPTGEQEAFIKQKFVEYNLDSQKLFALLFLLKELDSNNEFVSATGELRIEANSPLLKASTDHGKQDDAKDWAASTASVVQEEAGTDVSNDGLMAGLQKKHLPNGAEILQNKTMACLINPTSKDLDAVMESLDKLAQENQQSASSCGYDTNAYKKDPLYKQLTTFNNKPSKCTFSSEAEIQELQSRNRQYLAEATLKRNLDELKANCSRNTYYLNADEELTPSMYPAKSRACSVSQPCPQSGSDMQDATFGAPLSEARQTHVGSILPKFVYRETCTS